MKNHQNRQHQTRTLRKPEIEHIKDIHKVSGRAKSRTFLVEGRRQVESFYKAGYRPKQLMITHQQAEQLGSILDHPINSGPKYTLLEEESRHIIPHSSPNAPLISPWQSVQQFINNIQCDNNNINVSNVLHHPASSRMWNERDGTLLSPQSVVDDIDHNTVKLTTDEYRIYKSIYNKADRIESSIMSRISQHTTAPGLIAEFPFLDNISFVGYNGPTIPPNYVIPSSSSSQHQQQSQSNSTTDITSKHMTSLTTSDAMSDNMSDTIPSNNNDNIDTSSSSSSSQKHRTLPIIPTIDLITHHPLYNPFSNKHSNKHHHHHHHNNNGDSDYDNDDDNISKNTVLTPPSDRDWCWSKGGLILSCINDPGNVGTMIRTAHSLGIDQIITLDSADIYQHKTLSSTSGAIASPSIISTKTLQFLDYINTASIIDTYKQNDSINLLHNIQNKLKQQQQQLNNNDDNNDNNTIKPEILFKLTSDIVSGIKPYLVGLTLHNSQPLNTIPLTFEALYYNTLCQNMDKYNGHDNATYNTIYTMQNDPNSTITIRKPWLVVGSESHGIPAQIESVLDARATISMKHNNIVGSLNAAIAASIACFELANRTNGSQLYNNHKSIQQ